MYKSECFKNMPWMFAPVKTRLTWRKDLRRNVVVILIKILVVYRSDLGKGVSGKGKPRLSLNGRQDA